MSDKNKTVHHYNVEDETNEEFDYCLIGVITGVALFIATLLH